MPFEKVRPPRIPSEEATDKELEIARHQGDVFGDALDHMITEVADLGEEVNAGPYLISYAIEDAEGMYLPGKNGSLIWQEANGENLHLEVSVRDAADGRFIPELIVHARLINSQGEDVGLHQQNFIWHPWVYHYGRNWRVETSGTYSLEVEIKAPTFARHDKKNGHRYTQDIKAIFPNVHISV
jgi:uncharacterized protein involved in high-affinity Fe2+ transport